MNMLADRGELKQSVADEFNTESKGMKLPKKSFKFKRLKQMVGK